jgi:hypothetical protein
VCPIAYLLVISRAPLVKGDPHRAPRVCHRIYKARNTCNGNSASTPMHRMIHAPVKVLTGAVCSKMHMRDHTKYGTPVAP